MKIDKILCPTDFSAASQRALSDAMALAALVDARIKVVHVFQRPIGVSVETAPVTMEAATAFLAEAQKEARRALGALHEEWSDKGVELEVALLEGAPHAAIVEESKYASMIVMATHGRSGLQRFLLGSVAERVVRMAHCPVLCLPMTETEKEESDL